MEGCCFLAHIEARQTQDFKTLHLMPARRQPDTMFQNQVSDARFQNHAWDVIFCDHALDVQYESSYVGLQVMVAWGHEWRAYKREQSTRWMKPPTCWFQKRPSGFDTYTFVYLPPVYPN